jgi:hypothetical protein
VTVTKTLAEIVLDEELLDRRTLDKAARCADERNWPLAVALVRECGVDEVALLAALRKATRCATLDPAQVAFDTDALREVPREVCERRRVLPLALQAYGPGPRVLRMAMADPTDAVAIAEVEHLSGCRVEPALMTVSAIEELVDRAYKTFVTQVMKRGRRASMHPQPTTAPFHRIADEADARIVLQALVQLLADKQVIAKEELEEAVRALLRGRGDGDGD